MKHGPLMQKLAPEVVAVLCDTSLAKRSVLIFKEIVLFFKSTLTASSLARRMYQAMHYIGI